MKCKQCSHQISEHLLDNESVDGEKYPKNTWHRCCLVSGCLCSKIVKIYRRKQNDEKKISSRQMASSP